MKVKRLKEILEEMDDDLEIWIDFYGYEDDFLSLVDDYGINPHSGYAWVDACSRDQAYLYEHQDEDE